MANDRWQRAKELFDGAYSLDPRERDLFLRRMCPDDESLRAEVEKLIRNGRESGSFLQSPPEMPSTISMRREPRNIFADGELVLNRFSIIRFLGRGGMGEVYEVEDQSLGRRYALKTVKEDLSWSHQALARLKQEVLSARQVTSEHVCRVYEWLPVPEEAREGRNVAAFLTMELLRGESLHSRIRNAGPIALDEARVIARQLCSALAAAHKEGVIHRDFKTGNVMLTLDRQGAIRAVVTDFGLAKMQNEDEFPSLDLTHTGAVLGTVAYMSPEQLAGEPVTAATDIYALGIVLHEMVTGRKPDRARVPGSPIEQVLNPRWAAAIEACIRHSAADRPASAEEVWQILERNPEGAGSASQSLPDRRPWKNRKMAVAILSLVLLIGFAGWAWRYLTHSSGLPAEKHIAVLPLKNLSGVASDEAFCEGVVETLVGKLSQLQQFHREFWVVPSSDVRRITSSDDAHRVLGVSLMVTGSLIRLGGNARLILNLIDAINHRQLSSRTVEARESDIASLSDRASEQLANMLELEVRPEAKTALEAGGTKVPGAYEYYEQGMGYMRRYGASNIDTAIDLFKKALASDSRYALAFAGLAEAYSKKFEITKDPSLVAEVKQSSERAIAIDDRLAPVRLSVGLSHYRIRQFDSAIAEFQRVITADPTNFDAYYWLGRTYDDIGAAQLAESSFKRATDLRPSYWLGYSGLGFFYYRHSQYAKAANQFQTIINLAPDNPLGYENLGGTLLQMSRYDEALSVLRKLIVLKPTANAYSNIAYAYMSLGRYPESVPVLQEAVKLKPKDHRLWRNLGDAYRSAPGQVSRAAKCYEEALALAEGELSVRRDDPEVLCELALYQAKLGKRSEAAATVERVLAGANLDSTMLYNAALTSELIGQRGRALELLGRALAQGYSSDELKHEPDLAALRLDEHYAALLRYNPTSK